MHKGFRLIYFKIGKIEMQKPSTWRKQYIAISRMRKNFTHARISSASHFRPRTTPFCIFSNFTLNVILMSSYVYVISFVTEHYISSIKLVANQSIFQYRDETIGSCFPTFLLLSHFLSFSFIFSPSKHALMMKNQGMLG